MALIKSISGIRGTIGGKPDEGLTPIDIVGFVSAYAALIKEQSTKRKVVLGRDARISGEMVKQLVSGTLQACGLDVIDLGLATTPTVEMATPAFEAAGGIILTASHNPKQWNALKLLNEKGEFISGSEAENLIELVKSQDFNYVEIDKLGTYETADYLQEHIQAILDLPEVNVESIKAANFKIVVDAVNSVGGIAIPAMLKALGVEQIIPLFCEPTGIFPHNPEPLPENLSAISEEVLKQSANLGIVVDPDVDRLAFVCEDGSMFGEEYTLVAVADFLLEKRKGATVSNLSSSRALSDVTKKHGESYYASAVGEVNVVQKMKEVDALIGGEGNGGIIYPGLHYGRDALVGVALFLSHLAAKATTASMLRATYPNYVMSKQKIQLTPDIDVDSLLKKIEEKYSNQNLTTIDGVKIDLDEGWIHLRKSNTEPIIRIYVEGENDVVADHMVRKIQADIFDILKLS